jgi:hypothetical protein
MELFWLFAFMLSVIIFDTIVIMYLYVKLKESKYSKPVFYPYQ